MDNDVGYARQIPIRLFGDSIDGLAYHLPNRRKRNNAGSIVRGQEHTPLQVIFLAWAIAKEASTIKGGICGDAMGMGKTHEMISLMLAQDQLKPAALPTLLLCPVGLNYQHLEDLHDQLGSRWNVFAFGNNASSIVSAKLAPLEDKERRFLIMVRNDCLL